MTFNKKKLDDREEGCWPEYGFYSWHTGPNQRERGSFIGETNSIAVSPSRYYSRRGGQRVQLSTINRSLGSPVTLSCCCCWWWSCLLRWRWYRYLQVPPQPGTSTRAGSSWPSTSWGFPVSWASCRRHCPDPASVAPSGWGWSWTWWLLLLFLRFCTRFFLFNNHKNGY